MKIHFDLPFNAMSYVGTWFADSPFTHVRMVILDPMDGGKRLIELTTDGVKVYMGMPGQEFIVEGRTRNFFTLAIPITMEECINALTISETVKNYELKWSNWYIVSYLISGEFPSLSCCDLVSLAIKRGVVTYPSVLLSSLGDEIDELFFLKT